MHFEDIWEQAEAVAAKLAMKDIPDADHISLCNLSIIERLKDVSNSNLSLEERSIQVGEIIFDICNITRILNINAAEALRIAIKNNSKNE